MSAGDMTDLQALEIVREWSRAGRCPTDDEFVIALGYMLQDWKNDRSNGMDILASATLDEMSEIIESMKDLT